MKNPRWDESLKIFVLFWSQLYTSSPNTMLKGPADNVKAAAANWQATTPMLVAPSILSSKARRKCETLQT